MVKHIQCCLTFKTSKDIELVGFKGKFFFFAKPPNPNDSPPNPQFRNPQSIRFLPQRINHGNGHIFQVKDDEAIQHIGEIGVHVETDETGV